MVKTSLRASHLYKFLYKKRLLREFVENIVRQRPYDDTVIEYLEDKDLKKLMRRFSDINVAFTWMLSPQKDAFWRELHEEEVKSFNNLILKR